MSEELEQIPEDSVLFRLLELYANAGLDNPDAWQLRVMTLEGADDRRLSRLHGRLIAAGWLEFNIAAARAKNETMRCYRITAAGRRALRRALLGKDEEDIAGAEAA
ncbi:MAG TPA: hypothetical protein VGP68_10340 [Gemmataceae bacterium]|jgi:hypothetical protein|nr:hypothetical protein [Gemmataceae bacterium]